MECFAAYFSYHRRADRPGHRLPRGVGRSRQHRDRALLRQRRQLRGRRAPARSTTRAPTTARAPGVVSCAHASTSSAARPRTTTTRGAGRWPATHRSSGGSARCTKVASPIRASSGCRPHCGASAGAGRSGTSSRTRSTCCRPCSSWPASNRRARSTASRSRRSTAPAFSTRSSIATRPAGTPRSTSRCSAPRAIYHDGWKAVTFHALGNMYNDGLDADAPFDDDVWELYHVAEDLSETHDLAEQEPQRLAAMIDLWWEEARRNDVLPLDNRPLNAILEPAAAATRFAASLRLQARSARRCPNRRPYTYRTASTRSRPRSRSTARPWPRGCCSRWDQGWAVSRSTSATAACATCTTSTQGAPRHHFRRGGRTGTPRAPVRVHEDEGPLGDRPAPGRRPSRRRRRHPAVHADVVHGYGRRVDVRLRGRARRSATTTSPRSAATRRFGAWW